MQGVIGDCKPFIWDTTIQRLRVVSVVPEGEHALYMTDDLDQVLTLAKAMSRFFGPIVVRSSNYHTNQFAGDFTIVAGNITQTPQT